MVVTTPLIAFWLIGDRSAHEDPEANDYLVRVLIDHRVMLAVGLASTVVFVVAARYLYLHRSTTPNSRAAQLVALLMIAGLLVAAGLRMVTAGVTSGDANIGGAAFLVLGLPLCAALVIFAIVRYRRSANLGTTSRPA
jgi:hypothetical protein